MVPTIKVVSGGKRGFAYRAYSWTNKQVLHINHARIQRGGGGAGGHKNIGFSINTGPNPLKNHNATKPAFNFKSSSARQRNAIDMAFRWRADDGIAYQS